MSQAHLSHLPSLLSFIAVLGTTSCSDRHTPYTCPHEFELVEHRDCCSSKLFLSKSMSHSKGVDSVRAERVVRFGVGILILTQGCGYTSGGGHSEESISVGCLHSTAQTLSLIRGRAICDLAHYLIVLFVPSTSYLPFSLKRVSLRPTRVSRYQLDLC